MIHTANACLGEAGRHPPAELGPLRAEGRHRRLAQPPGGLVGPGVPAGFQHQRRFGEEVGTVDPVRDDRSRLRARLETAGEVG